MEPVLIDREGWLTECDLGHRTQLDRWLYFCGLGNTADPFPFLGSIYTIAFSSWVWDLWAFFCSLNKYAHRMHVFVS